MVFIKEYPKNRMLFKIVSNNCWESSLMGFICRTQTNGIALFMRCSIHSIMISYWRSWDYRSNPGWGSIDLHRFSIDGNPWERHGGRWESILHRWESMRIDFESILKTFVMDFRDNGFPIDGKSILINGILANRFLSMGIHGSSTREVYKEAQLRLRKKMSHLMPWYKE